MQDRTSITLTLEQRKLILELMNYSYTIPPEYHDCVAKAIKKYATKSYSDEAINKMVQKSQSVANSGFLISEDTLSLFRGKFAEWLACIEYNSLKNSGSVIMTIVNPDETSKADLLHFIKIGDEFKAVAGPDIKSGGSTYVFNQWKKIVTSRHDIPMVDFDDVLTTEDGLKQLTKKQREEFDQLSVQYPHKKPIPSAWTNQDELRLRMDYFKSILNIEGSFEYTPEIVPLLKEALANQSSEKLQELDWNDFNNKCKEIFKGVDFEAPDPTITNPISENNRHAKTNTISNDKNTKAMSFNYKSVINKVKSPKIIKTALLVGGSAAGALIVAKNPSLTKKVINTAVNKLQELKAGENVSKVSAAAKNVTTEVSATTIPDSVDQIIRKSPILHTVSSYVKKNGTVVESYPRGKTK